MGKKHRVLIVSGRLLVAESLASLLEALPEIGRVEIVENLYSALVAARLRAPDAILFDVPAGADLPVDRPVAVGGHEIKTIILEEREEHGQEFMYVYSPGRPACLQNLEEAITGHGPGASTHRALLTLARVAGARAKSTLLAGLDDNPAVPVAPQPASLMSASASGPSSSRMRSSKLGL